MDAPAIYQGSPNFSNAIAGSGFETLWSATPLELDVDAVIELRIRFQGVVNPDRVHRPDLANRASFRANFREIISYGEPLIERTAVEFQYHLKPRSDSIHEIPELAIAYYSASQDRVGTKYLDAIPLKIRPSSAKPETTQPIVAPERFFELPEAAAPWTTSPSWWHISIVAVALSALPTIWILVWRYRNPEGVRLARLRRHDAIRSTLDRLENAERCGAPLQEFLRILQDHLIARFGAQPAAMTPVDVRTAMDEAKLPADQIESTIQFLKRCDEIRFAGGGYLVMNWRSEFRALILSWETEA